MAHVTNFSSTSNSDHKTDHYLSNNSISSDSPVRIVLFKECRFKERQLLFDSLSPRNALYKDLKSNEPLKCSNLFLQSYSKPNEDFCYLTEMIFGSTAMRYHGTYFKVHNISSPERLVITQVFSTPYKKRLKELLSTLDSKNVLHSFCNINEWSLDREKNSIISMSNKSSNISFESSISIFRKNSSNIIGSRSSTSDSGFSEQSSYSSFDSNLSGLAKYSSFSSEPESLTSLNVQDSFLAKSESCTNPNLSYSRLGLAIIISLSAEKNKFQYFIMNHIPFIESILWRIRQYIEYASSTPRCFLSYMLDVTNESAYWLRELIVDVKVIEKFWNKNSFNESCSNNSNSSTDVKWISLFSKWRKIVLGKLEILKFRQHPSKFEKSCRLIQKLDTKENNFFMSSLLSVILVNYLGWSTACYESNSKEQTEVLRNPYNSPWCQLRDLCGLTGTSKTSRVILYNSNENIIKDALNFIQYFVRYSCVQKREIERYNIFEECEIVNNILSGGYLKEVPEYLKNKTPNYVSKRKSLNRTKTFSSNLSELANVEQNLDIVPEEESVIFILGDDEKLVDLRKSDIPTNMDTIRDKRSIMNEKYALQANVNNSSFFTKNENNNHTWNTKENNEQNEEENKRRMKVIKFPLPKVKVTRDYKEMSPYKFSFQNKSTDRFEPDFILQGTISPEQIWKSRLKNDLSSSQSFVADNNLEETVVILGDLNNSKINILSSKKQSFLRTSSNETVDASNLVADMLEVTQQMWTIGIPKQYCTTHIEQRLLEICLKSNAVAQLLLSSDFCTMNILLSTLGVTSSDMPLLMSVASYICPEITKKYGLSYQ